MIHQIFCKEEINLDNDLDKVVEALITATKGNEIKWNIAESDLVNEILALNLYEDVVKAYICRYSIKYDIRIFKYSYYLVVDGEGHGYQEKAILQMVSQKSNEVIEEITENDLSSPYRLWTLHKLVERSSNGAKSLIDDIIGKYYVKKDVIF